MRVQGAIAYSLCILTLWHKRQLKPALVLIDVVSCKFIVLSDCCLGFFLCRNLDVILFASDNTSQVSDWEVFLQHDLRSVGQDVKSY